jgi:hypothetical protein
MSRTSVLTRENGTGDTGSDARAGEVGGYSGYRPVYLGREGLGRKNGLTMRPELHDDQPRRDGRGRVPRVHKDSPE